MRISVRLKTVITFVMLVSMLVGSGFIYASGTISARASESAQEKADSGETDEALRNALRGITCGVEQGTPYDRLLSKLVEDPVYEYYNTYTDLFVDLDNENIDIIGWEKSCLMFIQDDYPDFTYLKTGLDTVNEAFMMPKTEKSLKLQAEINSYIEKIVDSGEYADIIRRWIKKDDGDAAVEIPTEGKNGTLSIVVNPVNRPAIYIKDGNLAGYEIDILAGFCRENGYGIKYAIAEFPSILAGLAAEKYDLGLSCIIVNEERKQKFYFTHPVYVLNLVAIVKRGSFPEYEVPGDIEISADDINNCIERIKAAKTETAADTYSRPGALESLKADLIKNFIEEDRWKLIAKGVEATLLITGMSAFFGTLLAFCVCVLRRLKIPAIAHVCDVYVRIMQGLPMVVLLMLLYYGILSGLSISGLWVSVIGFSLNTGAYVSELMQAGIESIDSGQREAALALGFTEYQAFIYYIFPQAAEQFLPVYRGQIISLLKGTAVVGYITVQDLTKISDIIRSRTFQPFLPLISTALIYFLLSWLIAFLLTQAEHRLSRDWKKQRSQLKTDNKNSTEKQMGR